MAANRPSGSGQEQPGRQRVSDRTQRQQAEDALIAAVGAGAALTLFATASSLYMWGCGVAFVVFFACLLARRYQLPVKEIRWGRRSLGAVTIVSGVAIPVLGLLPLIIPHAVHPQTAAVKNCRAAGTVGSNKHGGPPPGIADYLSMPVYSCSAHATVAGYIPVYVTPGSMDTAGEMNPGGRSWFVCWLRGPGAPAWYYTQGDFPGQTKYPQDNVWGFVASSLRPDPLVPGCPPKIR